jgi:flagellar assembly factor FliW
MNRCHTKEFGDLEYDDSAVVHFPAGLPAFENEKRFLLIERAETAPVVFLQSLATANLLFLALPARFIDPNFRLDLLAEERETLGLAPEPGPLVEGEDLISLAILTVREGEPVTANLLAPVVIGARSRRAVQIVQPESGYQVDHPVHGVATTCS